MNRLDDALATIDAALADGVTDVETDDPAADYARRNLAVPLDALFPDRGVWHYAVTKDPQQSERWLPSWRPADDEELAEGPDPHWHFPARLWLDDPYYQQELLLDAEEAYREVRGERRELAARLRLGPE